ncbi:MAG: hypothetical protein RLZZ15_3516 [Verrucomicrobiota bacterium]
MRTSSLFSRRSFLFVAFVISLLGGLRAVAADADRGEAAGSVAIPPGVSKDDVQKAIVATLGGREWTVQDKTEGRVVGYLKHRSNEATVTLVYDDTKIELYCVGYAINKSTGARQKPEQPKGWLSNLRNDLTKRLSPVAKKK